MSATPERHASIHRFNGACAVGAAAWLALAVPVSLWLWPTGIRDFDQYYVAGQLARAGRYDSLYATPVPGALVNPGFAGGASPKPLYAAVAQRTHAGARHHFVQPPPVALLCLPYGFLGLRAAFALHLLLQGLAAFGTALLAGRLVDAVLGAPSRIRGAAVLWVAASPLALSTLRVANVTPSVALGLAMGLCGLVDAAAPPVAAAGLVASALLKYASAPLVPLLLVYRRWRILAWALALGLLALAVSLLVEGATVHREFLALLPTLPRPALAGVDQSVGGVLERALGVAALPGAVAVAIAWARWLSLGAVLWLLWRRRAGRGPSPEAVVAAAAALIAWWVAFSPLSWHHYAFYFCPIWGWALVQGLRPGGTRVLAWAALALHATALAGTERFHLPLIASFHLLTGTLAFGALGIVRWLQLRR